MEPSHSTQRFDQRKCRSIEPGQALQAKFGASYDENLAKPATKP